MQCSRCNYIRFKSSPKCLNCGFDFKSQKSTAGIGESENEFTIFATVGAEAVAVSEAHDSEMELKSSPSVDDTVQESLVDEYDSSMEPQEAYIQESGDFELDLSDMDNPDSDDWVVGATLTEDLAEISNIVPNDSSESLASGANEFSIQGLGFNTIFDNETAAEETDSQVQNAPLDSEPVVLDEEMAVQEMEPYAPKSEIVLEPEKDKSTLDSSPDATETAQNESPGLSESLDTGPGQSLEVPADDSGDISLETELKLETKGSDLDLGQEEAKSGETSEFSIDLQDSSIEPGPMLELEDLDLALETESPEVIKPPQDSLQMSDATPKDQNRKEDENKNIPPFPEDNAK